MGITGNSLTRMQTFGLLESGKRILVCGCQNIYASGFDGVENGMIAQHHFNSIGVEAITIDITGCNGSYIVDLREDGVLNKFTNNGEKLFSGIVNHGTFEHIEGVEGFYTAYKNVHNSCEIGGIMIHETPKTGNWIGHGNHYLTEEFYTALAEKMGYTILEVGEHFAMGNTTDGGLVICVLEKTDTTTKEFISFEDFLTLDIRTA